MNLKEHENLLLKVEKAKEQIARLRNQQSELEREKAELEELRGKQEEWNRGKKEIGEELLKSIAILESEEGDVHRMGELIRAATDTLSRILGDLRAVKEERWTPATLKDDLTRSLLIIQSGRKELSKSKARIPALDAKSRGKAPQMTAPPVAEGTRNITALSAGEIVRIGFWFVLPFALMVVVIILLFSML